jgi:hypothetical protein
MSYVLDQKLDPDLSHTSLSLMINFADGLLFAGQEDASPVPARQSGLLFRSLSVGKN